MGGAIFIKSLIQFSVDGQGCIPSLLFDQDPETPQRLNQSCVRSGWVLTQTHLWVSRSLWERCGSAVACCRVGGTECGHACMGPCEGCSSYLHYLHHSLVSGKQQGRNTAPPINKKLDVPYETKNRVATWSCNPTPGPISGENSNLKIYMHPSVHSSTIYNS